VSAETRLTAAGSDGLVALYGPRTDPGKPALSNKTDLYALGCVMFELLCGRTPFTGEAMAEVLQQHIRQPPPRVSSFALDCPIQLESLIAELLQKDPDRRPQNAESVAARLREIDQDVTVKAPRFDKNRLCRHWEPKRPGRHAERPAPTSHGPGTATSRGNGRAHRGVRLAVVAAETGAAQRPSRQSSWPL